MAYDVLFVEDDGALREAVVMAYAQKRENTVVFWFAGHDFFSTLA